MSVSAATSYAREKSALEIASARPFAVQEDFHRPMLLHFDDSVTASLPQQAKPSMCLRGLYNGLAIELIAAAGIIGVWWLVHLS